MAGGQGEEGFRGSYQAELTGLAQSTLRCLLGGGLQRLLKRKLLNIPPSDFSPTHPV